MPCYYTGTAEGDARLIGEEALERERKAHKKARDGQNNVLTETTRAACEMAALIPQPMLRQLSRKTREWIKQHAKADAKRQRS